MTADSSAEGPSEGRQNSYGHESIAKQLRRRFGADVDPRISLASDDGPGRDDSSSASSAVLERMLSRGAEETRYELRGEVARGGMGAILEVWDADLRRSLAMKVALGPGGSVVGSGPGEFDPRMLARFLEEAQVTGQLEHPAIVPVHELACDSEGRVFFTMPLIRGRDLEEIFQRVDRGSEDWSTTRALGVLSRVCEAMAYAHAKGVVHRDLKPANVMVGGFGEVYVMDWGLARVQGRAKASGAELDAVATDRRDASRRESASSAFDTMEGDVVGTPAYMAPEQARGELEALDERTDVYSLGAMLYRLLAGTAPYVPRGDSRSAIEVLSELMAGPPTALEELAPDAPPELVAIATKAMMRAQSERYADMGALAEDLRAFLENRVVRAYETGAIAETRKWLRRNKPLAAALAATVVALAAGLGVSLAEKARADENAEVARQNAAAAQREARTSAEVNAFLNDDLLGALAPEAEGFEVTVRAALDAAAARLEGRFPGEPLVEADLRLTIGTSYRRLGEFERALVHLERCVELRSAELGAAASATLLARGGVADALREHGSVEASLVAFDAAVAAAEEAFGSGHAEVLTLCVGRGLTLTELGRYDAALEELEGTLAELRRVAPDAAMTWSAAGNLGVLLYRMSRFAEAEELQREVLDHSRRTWGARHPSTMNAMNNLGLALSGGGQYAASEKLYREALEVREEVFGPQHPRTGRAEGALAHVLFVQGKLDEAERRSLDALATLRPILGDEHPDTLLAMTNLSSVYQGQGRYELALPLRLASLEVQRRVRGEQHPETLQSMNNLAVLYRNLQRFSEAEELYRATHAVQRETLGELHSLTLITYENLGGVLFARGEREAALVVLREVLDGRRQTLGSDHPDVGKTLYNLGMVYRASGSSEAALACFEEANELQLAFPGNGADRIEALERIGEMRMAAGELEASLEALAEALDLRRERGEVDGRRAAQLLELIGSAHRKVGRAEAGAEALEASLALHRDGVGGAPQDRLRVQYLLARALLEGERFEACEAEALACFEELRQVHGDGHPEQRRTRRLLVELYTAWGRSEAADAWR